MNIDLGVRAHQDMSPAERYAVGVWMWEVFGGTDQRVWAVADWHVMVCVEGEMVSQVEIVERTCTADGQPVRVGGIGGVSTREGWRHRGLATRALERALSFMRAELDLDYGLLVCEPDKIPFYGRLGWKTVPGPVFYDQPGRKIEDHGPTMVWCRDGAEWPAGVIDYCGLPW